MTQIEIEKSLQKDLIEFYNKPFAGELPDNFIDLFKIAIFHVPPQRHQIHVVKIIQIFNKTEEELLFGEVGMILKTIMEAEPSKLYDRMEDFLTAHEIFERLYIQYNSEVADFSRRQERKKNSLMQLGGVNGNSGGKNGMRVLKN